MSWKLEPARSSFGAHASDWNALNREQGDHLLLDADFVRLLVHHFATPATLLARSTLPGVRGFALIERGRLGFATTFQPSQCPVGLILMDSAMPALVRTRDLIRCLPGFGLGISILQQDPDYSYFRRGDDDRSVEYLDYIDTGRLRLEGTFEAYWVARSKNLVHNLSRQRRRIDDEGRSLRLRIVEDPGQVPACVEVYGRLEGSGWKAAGGTAVSSANVQGAFYRDVLEAFMRRREGFIFQLELDGQVIASDLCLVRGNTMVILKTAYDASIEKLSPGLLLHQDIWKYCYETGVIRIVEFYGRARDWHSKWTTEFRRMYHLNVYRSPWIARACHVVRSGIRGSGAPPAT